MAVTPSIPASRAAAPPHALSSPHASVPPQVANAARAASFPRAAVRKARPLSATAYTVAASDHGPCVPARELVPLWCTIAATLTALLCSGCQWAASGQNAVGARLYEQGQYSAALQQFQKVLVTDPANADGYYNLAATNHRLGNQRQDAQLLAQAESLYNQCLDHDPNHVECHRGLAVLLVDTGRPDRAFALMKNWANQNPHFAEPRIELARLYEEANDPQTALKYLEDAVQKDANNARAWLALGRLREQGGDLEQALRNYQQSLAINNMQPAAMERVAALSRQISANFESSYATGQTQIASPSGFQSGLIRR